MKKLLGFVVVVLVGMALYGCGKKQEIEELQPITMESLGTTNVPATAQSVEVKAPQVQAAAEQVQGGSKEVLPLPPGGPYKPTNIEIQTALSHAGFYAGKIDGKIGPKSKKAIEDFQSANSLKVDGKVGPKTWEALSKHLISAPEPVKR